MKTIKKGDVVYIEGNAKHALKNVGTETLVILLDFSNRYLF